MMPLIISEWKKILKHKLNLFLLLAMTGFMAYTTWDCYHEDLPYDQLKTSVLKTFDGKELTNMNDVYRYANQILSQYEGKATQESWQRYCDDFNRYHEQFSKEVDTEQMIKVYGKDYEQLFHTLSQPMEENESWAFIKQYEGYQYNPESKMGSLPIFYKQQAELSTLNLIYLNRYDDSMLNGELLSEENNLASPLYLLSHKEEQIKQMMLDEDTTQAQIYNSFIKTTLDQQDQSYGSDASMRPLITAFDRFTLLSLLVIPILLANSFAIERRVKTDQIIVPSRVGYVRITAAKIIAGSLLGMMTMILQIICIYVIAYLILKPEGWNLPMMNQVHGYGNIGGYSYMTYATYFLGRIQLLIIGALAISFTTLFLSAITKNQFVTVISNLLFFMLPFFFSEHLPIVLQKLLPCFMAYDTGFFYYIGDHSFLVNILDQTFWWKDVVSIFWIGMVILITMIMLLHARRNYVSNK